MKKKNAVLILLFLALAAGLVSGSYLIYAGHRLYLFVLAGILCYLAFVSAAVLIHYERKGITGKHLRRARILTAVLGVPLVLCTVVAILQACGVCTIIPPHMTSGNWHPEFSFREKVKGGLTGYAQVYGKYNTTALDKLKLDLIYITEFSIILDLQIIIETIKILFMKDSTEGFSNERVKEMQNSKNT